MSKLAERVTPEIRARAEEIWGREGYTPEDVISALILETVRNNSSPTYASELLNRLERLVDDFPETWKVHRDPETGYLTLPWDEYYPEEDGLYDDLVDKKWWGCPESGRLVDQQDEE